MPRVLVVHNFYKQGGGEDAVYRTECDLLREKGHAVHQLEFTNNEIADQRSPLSSIRLATTTIWSRQSHRRLHTMIARFKPDVVHFHNTFPLVSPSAYAACRQAGVPVVQTLHNFRLMCPAALFFRDGRPCEDCLGQAVPWPGLVHACYRDSRAQTAVVSAMLTTHRLRRTWARDVDRYIALTQFARDKFIEGGLPGEKIAIKPNFVHPDPGASNRERTYALFVGRLSAEKGVETMVRAWELMEQPPPLKIVGDGPLDDMVRDAAGRIGGIEWLGRRPPDDVYDLLAGARFLVFPSTCYEGFPRTIVEAFAVGVPVIASRLGGMGVIVSHEKTGFHFKAGDAPDLARQVKAAVANPDQLFQMRRLARQEYEDHYTAEANYQQLMRIYEEARVSASRLSRPHVKANGADTYESEFAETEAGGHQT